MARCFIEAIFSRQTGFFGFEGAPNPPKDERESPRPQAFLSKDFFAFGGCGFKGREESRAGVLEDFPEAGFFFLRFVSEDAARDNAC